METLKKLAFILVVPSILLNLYFFVVHDSSSEEPVNTPAPEAGFKVVEVWDGDTIVLEGDLSVRLANINAPEAENCMGEEANKLVYDWRVNVI